MRPYLARPGGGRAPASFARREDSDVWHGHALPEAVLGRRLARLSDQCRAVLSTAAALGKTFTLETVQQVTGVETLPLLELLEEAVAARLVREAGVGRYAFRHALVRQVVCNELGLAHRVRLRQRVGEALGALRDRGMPSTRRSWPTTSVWPEIIRLRNSSVRFLLRYWRIKRKSNSRKICLAHR
jgi:hypothetical protein